TSTRNRIRASGSGGISCRRSNVRGRVATAQTPMASTGERPRTGRARARLGETWRSFALGTLSVIVLLSVWQAVTAGGYISPIFLPSPLQVFRQARRY